MSHTDGLKDMSHDTALDAVKDYFDSIVTAVDNVDISLAATITPADDPDGAPAREAQLCNFYAKALIPCLRRLAHEDADKLDLVAAPLTKLYALAHRYTLWRRDRRFPLDDASVDVVLSLFVTPIAHVVMAVHHALLLARLIDGTDVIAPIEIDYEAHITASEQQSPEILYIDGFHRSAAVLFTSEVAVRAPYYTITRLLRNHRSVTSVSPRTRSASSTRRALSAAPANPANAGIAPCLSTASTSKSPRLWLM